MGEASPCLSGADNILVAEAGLVLYRSFTSICGCVPSFSGNGLCLLKDCFHLFSSPVPVAACLAIWAAGRNSQVTCEACAFTRTLQDSWNECLEAGDGSQCHHLVYPTVACSSPYTKGGLSLWSPQVLSCPLSWAWGDNPASLCFSVFLFSP